MTEYKYTTETWGPVFVQLTHDEGGECWVNVNDILAVYRVDSMTRIMLPEHNILTVKDTPTEIMKGIKEWKKYGT